jgi:hypothetical protein
MAPDTGPEELDFSYLLRRDPYYQFSQTLRTTLPAPVADAPADLARRNNAAVAFPVPARSGKGHSCRPVRSVRIRSAPVYNLSSASESTSKIRQHPHLVREVHNHHGT